MNISELVSYLECYLSVSSFQDYAPNGLQVEGKSSVGKIITGVTASKALIDEAIAVGADAILVHHGYFWKNEPSVITGYKKERIKKLLTNDVNLLAYHLPLDAHKVLGNNAMLAKLWGLKDITSDDRSLVRLGCLEMPMAIEEFKKRVDTSLNRVSMHLKGGPSEVQKIAWCSGGAQNSIQQAIEWGADVYVSGEVSEQTTHIAAEAGIHYFSAGHHATEVHGIKALGEHLAEHFGLEVIFINIETPV